MVDKLIYEAKDKLKAFEVAWVERGNEFASASMPAAARRARDLVADTKLINIDLDEILKKDRALDKDYDKFKKEKKMYA